MDKLEQFIVTHRTDFDTPTFEGESRLWAAIEQELEQKSATSGTVRLLQPKAKARTWQMPMLRAAAAVLLLVVGAAAGFYWSSKNTSSNSAVAAQTEAQNPELKEAEAFYTQQVAQKVATLTSYEAADPTVMADLKQIDDVQTELRAALAEAPTSSREEIVATMMKNYRIKLDILERVLRHVEQKNQQPEHHSPETHLKNDSL